MTGSRSQPSHGRSVASWTTRDGADRMPVIPSHEMSGTVLGIGGGTTGLAVGDEVIGLIDFDRDGAAANLLRHLFV